MDVKVSNIGFDTNTQRRAAQREPIDSGRIIANIFTRNSASGNVTCGVYSLSLTGEYE